jgi:hypothetical protein
MTFAERPLAFWIFAAFLVFSIVLLVAGQMVAVFNYELTVRLGLQESMDQVSEFGVQVNRAFGASDTVLYIPLIIASLIGLLRRRRWALLTTAAVSGISAYWSVTAIFIFLFLPGTPGYSYVPDPTIWMFVSAYAVFGVWGLLYLLIRGDALLQREGERSTRGADAFLSRVAISMVDSQRRYSRPRAEQRTHWRGRAIATRATKGSIYWEDMIMSHRRILGVVLLGVGLLLISASLLGDDRAKRWTEVLV